MDEKLLDVEAVAGLLKISKRMIWGLRDSGRIPAPIRIGKCVRWRQSELMSWIEAGCPSCRPQVSAARGVKR